MADHDQQRLIELDANESPKVVFKVSGNVFDQLDQSHWFVNVNLVSWSPAKRISCFRPRER